MDAEWRKGYPYRVRNPWDVLTEAEQRRIAAAAALREAEREVRDAARVLHGTYSESWDSIASALGIHRQTAYERFRQRS